MFPAVPGTRPCRRGRDVTAATVKIASLLSYPPPTVFGKAPLRGRPLPGGVRAALGEGHRRGVAPPVLVPVGQHAGQPGRLVRADPAGVLPDRAAPPHAVLR